MVVVVMVVVVLVVESHLGREMLKHRWPGRRGDFTCWYSVLSKCYIHQCSAAQDEGRMWLLVAGQP